MIEVCSMLMRKNTHKTGEEPFRYLRQVNGLIQLQPLLMEVKLKLMGKYLAPILINTLFKAICFSSSCSRR